MILDELKDKKIISIIPFLSAGLYHLGFWSTFGINIFSFYNLQGFIISFLYPFLYSSVIFIVFITIMGGFIKIVTYISHGNETQENKEYYHHKNQKIKLKILLIVYNSLGVILIFWFLTIGGTFMWILIPLTALIFFGRYIVEFLTKKEYIKIGNQNREITLVLIMIITLAYSTGKFNSLQIKENVEFDYIIHNNEPKKFLGKVGDFFIISKIDNSSKRFIDNSKITEYELLLFNSLSIDSKKDSLILRLIEKERKKEKQLATTKAINNWGVNDKTKL